MKKAVFGGGQDIVVSEKHLFEKLGNNQRNLL